MKMPEKLTLIVGIGVLNGVSDAMHVIRTQWISPLRCICLWWWLYGYVRIQMHTLQSITHQTLRWHCNYTVYVSTAIVKSQRLRFVLFYFTSSFVAYVASIFWIVHLLTAPSVFSNGYCSRKHIKYINDNCNQTVYCQSLWLK